MTEVNPRELMKQIVDEHRAIALGIYAMAEQIPWLAPVYYVYKDFQFFFYSDPAACHVAALAGREEISAAGAIFNEPPDYLEIRGLQMAGTIQAVGGLSDQAWALAEFGRRFTFFAKFLRDPQLMLLLKKNRLYKFKARRVFIIDNRQGFGFGDRFLLEP
ncbi:MAG: hypothetical protein PHC60_02735 [Heliobacteriaceae bacterium]|nr:hypothetical protein [Heliobacteriaceae bacterium]MDD4587297.1 hypothetical protein [Heliobacteriaceae bacterium]